MSRGGKITGQGVQGRTEGKETVILVLVKEALSQERGSAVRL